ncbi:DUF1931 domain-containing protein [halophilic archaeon]|nr:DUF1931 domain-containing protein [halophilic archaeon]
MQVLIYQAAMEDTLSQHNVSADFYNALDEEVVEPLEHIARRTEANDRETVQ